MLRFRHLRTAVFKNRIINLDVNKELRMKQKLTRIVVFWFLFFALTGSSFIRGEKKELSLEDCILMAMKNNLNLAIEVLNPELSNLSVARAWEKFIPNLSFTYNKRSTETASYSWLDASTQVETQYHDYSAQLSQFLPTGADLTITLNTDKTDTNRNFQTINPRFGSTLRFDFKQPLLKNFGIRINRREIIAARNNRQMSVHRFKTLLLDTIYQVEDAYWNLVYSIENLKVRQQSLTLARELLAKNKKSVEIGNLAPIEIKSAEAEVATREADILEAEALIMNNNDRLKTIINLNAGRGDPDIEIIPVDKPISEQKSVALETAIHTAFENRPDLKEREIDIKNKKLDLNYARNQMLPELNLEVSYWSPGISGTQLLYQDNNPLTGIVVDTVPGKAGASMKDAFDFLYKNWSVALALNIPLNTVFSRAQVAQAVISLDQSRLGLKEKEQQVILEIKNAVRAVETNFKRVKAYRVARELTGDKLRAEEQKLKVGLSTNYNLLLAQRDFSDARSIELRAIIDYSLSIANLDKALGISLEEKNIKVK